MTQPAHNPFEPPHTSTEYPPALKPSEIRPQLIAWIAGAMLLTVFFAVNALSGDQLPGSLFFLVLAASFVITQAASLTARISVGVRCLGLVAWLLIVAAQLIGWAAMLIATTGLDGTQ